MFKLIVLSVIYVACSDGAQALRGDFCGKCSPISGVKCIDETTFAFCDRRGVATNRVAVCPSGYKCSNTVTICTKTDKSECVSKCGKCENGRFSCLGLTAFNLCFGKNETSAVSSKCGLGKVCSTSKYNPSERNPDLGFCFPEIDLDPADIDCFKYNAPTYVMPVKPEIVSISGGKPIEIIPHVTPFEHSVAIPEEDPMVYCKRKATGKYQILSDVKCQKYYYCYHNGYQMVGKTLTCAEHSVFSQTTEKCVRTSVGYYSQPNCAIFRLSNQTIYRMPSYPYLTPATIRQPTAFNFLSYWNQMGPASYLDASSYPSPILPSNRIRPLSIANPVHPIGGINPLSPWEPSTYNFPLRTLEPVHPPDTLNAYVPPQVRVPAPIRSGKSSNMEDAKNTFRPVYESGVKSGKGAGDYLNPMNRWSPNQNGQETPLVANEDPISESHVFFNVY